MVQRLSGRCACGTIRYETDAEPVFMVNCHCRDCQRASGSAYAAYVMLPKGAVRIQGEPHYHRVIGDAGKAVERGFCPNCGSPVATRLERLPELLGLQAGSLDDPSRYKPVMEMFVASAQPWDHLSPETQKMPHGPPGS
jgi:hypothetical protein